jgi:hypothetical protein
MSEPKNYLLSLNDRNLEILEMPQAGKTDKVQAAAFAAALGHSQ